MHNSSDRMDTVLRWVARIWSLPAILFAAGELVAPHAGTAPVPPIEWVTLGLQFIAVAGLALAWRWEVTGGTLSILTMLASFVLFAITRGSFNAAVGLIWIGFIILPAAMFVACGLRAGPADPTPA